MPSSLSIFISLGSHSWTKASSYSTLIVIALYQNRIRDFQERQNTIKFFIHFCSKFQNFLKTKKSLHGLVIFTYILSIFSKQNPKSYQSKYVNVVHLLCIGCFQIYFHLHGRLLWWEIVQCVLIQDISSHDTFMNYRKLNHNILTTSVNLQF